MTETTLGAAGMDGGDEPGFWCRRCGKPVLTAGGEDVEPSLRKAVHAATGLERGAPEGHIVAPVDYEPPLWRSARLLEEEFGGAFEIGARFGFLRADWRDAGPVCVEHYEASGPGAEEELRVKLRRAFVAAGMDPPSLAGAVP